MGFKKNQKRNRAHHVSKIHHSKLMKSKDKDAADEKKEQQDAKRKNEVERMDYKIKSYKSKQQSNREKLLERMRGMLAESTSGSNEQQSETTSSEQHDDSIENKIHTPDLSNLASFYKEFNKVLESADVLIEVLDARDPLGTRCEEIEKAVIAAGPKKRLILLLNKVDLIPSDNLKAWLKYLRNQFPTIAFKASTQKQKSNLGRINKDILNATESMLKSSKCIGANHLMKILGNYCRNRGIRTAINVGVVGYPNVGKSSVINSLIRNKSCGVGSTPGFTKSVQYINLDSKIKLLDSPGIVFAKANNKESSELQAANLSLRNCIKIEQLSDPILPVKAILSRVTRDEILNYYGIQNFETVDRFLVFLAKRFGKLKRGGIPDTYAAAKQILNDWNIGKIKYYTCPPDINDLPTYISTELIGEFSKGFNIDNDEELDNKLIKDCNSITSEIVGANEENGKVVSDDKMEEEKDEFEDVLNKDVVIKFKNVKVKSKDDNQSDDPSLSGMQLNRQLKMHFKRQKRQQKRTIKISEKMSKELEGLMLF